MKNPLFFFLFLNTCTFINISAGNPAPKWINDLSGTLKTDANINTQTNTVQIQKIWIPNRTEQKKSPFITIVSEKNNNALGTLKKGDT